MQNNAPVRGDAQLISGRGWLPPAAVLALLLAVSYLPAHGVVRLLDILAATIAALGLVAVSVAVPRLARGMVTGSGLPILILGSSPLGHEIDPSPSPGRRIAAVALGAAVSAAGAVAAAVLMGNIEPAAAGHAVLVVALMANLGLLVSNVTPIPPWPGWILLIALLDRGGLAAQERIGRAVPIARRIVVGEAAALAAVALAVSDWMLLLLPALLIWHVWLQTTIAQADAVIDLYLTTRRLGEVARPLASTAKPEEPALMAAARRSSAHAVIAVMEGDTFRGAIGPRQLAAVPPTAPTTSCRNVMIAADRLELLRADAPATDAMPQLGRFGFAIVTSSIPPRYVQVDELLQQIRIAAAIEQRITTSRTASPADPVRPNTKEKLR